MYLPNHVASNELLFVYGTLKKGFRGNNIFLKDANLCAYGRTRDKYTMISFGKYPGVVLTKPTSYIYGEVYSLPSLSAIDGYENYPSFYNRTKVVIYPSIQAWMYYLTPEYLINHPFHPIIESGIFIDTPSLGEGINVA